MTKYLKDIELFVFDLDGTVYVGQNLIPGALEIIDLLRRRAKVCFLTNNSSRSKAQYLQKLSGLGLDVTEDELLTSTDAAVMYLEQNCPGAGVYALATPDVLGELTARGIRLDDKNPDVVLLTYDTALTYQKLADTAVFLKRGAKYVATHADLTCPAEEAYLPDAGSFMALIEAATGRRPDAVCGKPGPVLARAIAQRYGVPAKNTAMFGDRQYTDILFAKQNGMRSVLVLTGESKPGEITVQPDLVLGSIADISKLI